MKEIIILLVLFLSINVCYAQTVCNGNYCYDTNYTQGQNQQSTQKPISYANPQMLRYNTPYSQFTNDTRNTLYNAQSGVYTAQQAIFTAKNLFNQRY
ncbi:MAG: hypothetical protein WCG95_06945 [bacterium]